MKQTVGSPHDRFVRHCFEDLELAKAFFRRFLAPDKKAAIDLDALEPGGKENYTSDTFKSVTIDVLLRAPIQDHPGFLSLLIEHKSEGAARGGGHSLPFQMRLQEMMIMDYFRRIHPNKRYPLVYMVGLYHGTKPYEKSRTVGEDIEAPAAMVPERWRETIELIDLSAYTDKELIDDGKLGIFLLVLKHIYATDIDQTIAYLAPRMQEIEQQQDSSFIKVLFNYLFQVAKVEKRENIFNIAIKTFSRELGDYMLTIAESWKEEGRKEGWQAGEQKGRIEGRQAGRQEGRIETQIGFAKLMLADNHPLDYITKLTGLTRQEVQALADQRHL